MASSKKRDRMNKHRLLEAMIEDKKLKRKYGERPKPPDPATRRPEDERKKVMVIGTRDFDDYRLLKRKMNFLCEKLKDPIVVVGEESYGAGKLACKWASWNWLLVKTFEPNFDEYGRTAAYHVRNRDMTRWVADRKGVCVAFWDGVSPGTKSTIALCRKYHVKVVIVSYEED